MAELEPEAVDAVGRAEVNLDLEPAGAGVEQGDGTGVGPEGGNELIQHLLQCDMGVIRPAGEGGQPVERRQGARVLRRGQAGRGQGFNRRWQTGFHGAQV